MNDLSKIEAEVDFLHFKAARDAGESNTAIVAYFGSRAAGYEIRYRTEKTLERLCDCGAAIASDESSCSGCRRDDNRDHDRELERQFPRRGA